MAPNQTTSQTKAPADPTVLLQKYLKGEDLSEAEMLQVRKALAERDKAMRAKNPQAKGLVSRGSRYESQEMDEAFDVLNDLISGKTDVPGMYNSAFKKEEAIELRDALSKVVRLGSKFVTKGHILDVRFDSRGHGWAKATEIWRKNEESGKNEQQDHFESYKDNPTVKLL